MTCSETAQTAVQRTTFESCGEYSLALMDFSGVRTTQEALAAIAEARRLVAEHPPFSLRVLTNVTDSHISLPVMLALQDLVRSNAPYVTKSAIYGLSLPHRVALRQIRRLTGRDIREFATREDALEYLKA